MVLACALAVALLLAACSGSAGTPSPGGSAAASPSAVAASPSSAGGTAQPSPTAPVALKVGLGYIPSVQFAQFYLADQAGYYRDAGLDVTFDNKTDPDLIRLTGQGAVDVSLADGTSLIPAVSQGIPVTYIATIYAKFPNVVFAKASSGIRTAADLKGKRIGTPGRYGSGWVMLQALLASAGLTVDDVTVVDLASLAEPLPCVLFEWIDGPLLDRRLTVPNVERVGALAASLHRHGTRFRPPPGFAAVRYDRPFPFDEPVVLFDDQPLVPPARRAVYRAALVRVRYCNCSIVPVSWRSALSIRSRRTDRSPASTCATRGCSP
jgi:hypothetical protein